jgi:hypothetical protein
MAATRRLRSVIATDLTAPASRLQAPDFEYMTGSPVWVAAGFVDEQLS